MANTGLNSYDKDGKTSMGEIRCLCDESVVRETHADDVINSFQSVFTTESTVPFSPIIFKKKKNF